MYSLSIKHSFRIFSQWKCYRLLLCTSFRWSTF